MFEELFAASITILTFFGATYVVIAQMTGDQFSPQMVPRLHRTLGLKYLVVLGLMSAAMGAVMIWGTGNAAYGKPLASVLAVIEVVVAVWVFYSTLTAFNGLSKSPFKNLPSALGADVTGDLLVKAFSNHEVRKLQLVLSHTHKPEVHQALMEWLEHNDYALQEKWFRTPLINHLLKHASPTQVKTQAPVLKRTLKLLLEEKRYSEAQNHMVAVMRSLQNQAAFTEDHRNLIHALARVLWYDPESETLRDTNGNQVLQDTQGYFHLQLRNLMFDVLQQPKEDSIQAFAETLDALAGDIPDDLLITRISEFADDSRLDGYWTAELVKTLLNALEYALGNLQHHPDRLILGLEEERKRVRRIGQEIYRHTPVGTPDDYRGYLRNKARIP